MKSPTVPIVLKVVKRGSEWFVTNMPDGEDCGPYPTKERAEDDARGMERTYKYHDQPGFITCEAKST